MLELIIPTNFQEAMQKAGREKAKQPNYMSLITERGLKDGYQYLHQWGVAAHVQ